MSVCVIGCIFGKKFKTVYPSVKNYDAYFFTNNSEIRETVEKAGWKYIFIDFPLSEDDAVSSFQSKYVKFLQFLKNGSFAFFRSYERIIYTDHKLEVKDEHIEYLLSKMEDKMILIIEHFQDRKNIWVELGEAMFQERYLRFMPQTIDYIKKKMDEGYSEKCVIVLTGLIVYKHLENKTIEFTDKIYNDLKRIGTSQCQIIWSILGQNYTDIIKTIKWNELKIMPKEPGSEKEETESVGYLKQELRNKTAHMDLLERSVNYLEEELRDETTHVERLIESERHLQSELQNKTEYVERLILSERELNAEINNKLNSRSWKIASKISAFNRKIFPIFAKKSSERL